MNSNWPVQYRPKAFSEVVGHEILIGMLQKIAFDGQIPAIMLCGPSGVGKTTLLRLYANALSTGSMEARETTSDLLEVDGATHGNVETLRSFVHWCQLVPQHGRYRVVLIDEVHAMSREAFTVLLRLVEEPPERARFCFATTNPDKVPATISGRSMVFVLRPVGLQECQQRLEQIMAMENIDLPADVLQEILRITHGHVRNAIKLLQQVCQATSPTVSLVRSLEGFAGAFTERDFLDAVFKGDQDRLMEYCEIVQEQNIDLAKFLKSTLLVFDQFIADLLKGNQELQFTRFYVWMEALIQLYQEVQQFPGIAGSIFRAWCAKILQLA